MINKITNKLSIIIFLFCFIVINLYLSFSIIKANEINNSIVRIHVVANSNDIPDQIIKLKVSEVIENYISTLNLENKNSEEILNILNSNKENILYLANNELKNNNVNYNSIVSIGRIYYDENKENAIYSMDKGYYNSIKISLGKASGKNFWNFIAPNKKNLERLKKYETILPGINSFSCNNESNINYKSKILELLK